MAALPPPSSSAPSMTMSGIVHRFGQTTSMHGVPNAIRARSTAGRFVWSVACLAAALMFSLQLAQILYKYFSYPKKVVIEVVPLPVPFPAISLCNLRNLDNIVLNQLNHIFKAESDVANISQMLSRYENGGNETTNAFIVQYLKAVAKYYPMFLSRSNDTSFYHVFRTVLTRTTLATNIDPAVLSAAGVPFKEFIVTCRLAGMSCNFSGDFAQFFDSYYYNCFTYQAPSDPLEASSEDSSLAEGLENGWSTTVLTGSSMLDRNDRIRVIPGTHEYLSPMSSSEGVRVVIHPPNTEPYPHTEGFDVPPGYSASFGVRSRKNIRIGLPYGNCSMENPFQEDEHDYRLVSCQKHCLQRAIVRQCGCKDVTLPGRKLYPDVPYCSDDSDVSDECRYDASDDCFAALHAIYNRFVCARNVSAEVSRSRSAIRDCKCYPPCSEIAYDVSYSLSRWPADSFDGDEAYSDIFETESYHLRFLDPEDADKAELYGAHFDPFNRSTAMRDFARLNVYIADSNVVKTEEQVDYASSQLLADIGGQLGLWVGVSVITLAEVVEFLLDAFRYLNVVYGPYGRGKNMKNANCDVWMTSSLPMEDATVGCQACRCRCKCNNRKCVVENCLDVNVSKATSMDSTHSERC